MQLESLLSSPTLKISSSGLSHVGMKRAQNEDHYLLNEKLHLYAVADGMGGHLGGEFASRMAVTTLEEVMQRLNSVDSTLIHGLSTESTSVGEQLKYAIKVSGQRIYDQSLYDESLKGMGTTAVALMIQGTKAYIANVGDSRGHLIREGKITQITEDHSWIGEQLRAGFITEEELRGHRMKNIITRSVGFQEEVETDLIVKELQSGDTFLLCSDGLSNLVEKEEMLQVAGQLPLKEACEKLVKTANERGGDDNITVVLVRVL